MIGNIDCEVTKLDRHLHVLQLVIDNEPIGIMTMSNETGYPRHRIRYSLRILEAEELTKPTNHGAVTTERTADYITEYDEKIANLTGRLDQLRMTPEQPELIP